MAKKWQKAKLGIALRVLLIWVFLVVGGSGVVQGFSKMGVPGVLKKLAQEYSEKGFKLRKEHWNGKLKIGQHKVVKHQLFRGNEYWFLAAITESQHALEVEVFDESGQAISLEKFSNKGLSGARVLPVKTGTYLIKLTVNQEGAGKEGGADLDWALVYGYR
ncbi:MAG: T9SS type A sorting domain-containing protein [Verrucomicrobiota bacterium]